MTVEVRPVTVADETVVRNLWQLYCYDFSRFMGWPLQPDGRFSEHPLAGCWPSASRHPFLLAADGGLVGFAIVDRLERSTVTNATALWDMAQFFVVASLRRRGTGAAAAAQLFDRFPGRWEVREIAANVSALHFWRVAISRYTGGRFTEVVFADGPWRGTVQTFDTADRTAPS